MLMRLVGMVRKVKLTLWLGAFGASLFSSESLSANRDENTALRKVDQISVISTSIRDVTKPLRIRAYNELMSSSLGSASTGVPNAEGSSISPMNLYGWVSFDYEFSDSYRFLYQQRYLLDLANSQGTLGATGSIWDPRLGVRKEKVIDVRGLDTTYDLYIQPGVTFESQANAKSFDLGFRTNSTYTFAGSRWSIGAITEIAGTFYSSKGKGADFSGFLNPWASYSLTPKFSTQHWVLLPFQHERHSGWNGLGWDMPSNGPIIQNGISCDLSERVWVSVLLNNHLTTLPTLKNSWGSLWVSLKIF